jgi:prolycopene isomerase
VSNATRWDTFGKLLDRAQPIDEDRWQERYQKSPSFLSVHMGVRADALPAGIDCHHILVDHWDHMEQAYGTVFVSIPTLLDPDLAPPDRHILHVFTPAWISDWQHLSPNEYAAKKQAKAKDLRDRLAPIIPNLEEAIDYIEIGTPRTHRRFLGRIDGSYGPIPTRKLPGLLTMPFNRTAVPNLYCVGDSTFPGQGLNAVAFSGFACAHRVAADLGLL